MQTLSITTGNYILNDQEITELRKAVLDKYMILSGKKIDKHSLNSNGNNYKELYDHIDSVVSLKNMGISSSKPLVSLFYESRPTPKAFRKKFIDALYQYSFSRSREESNNLKVSESNSISEKQMRNLQGYWECYYSKSNTFKGNFESIQRGRLCVVGLTIMGENIHKAIVTFFQKDNWGKGSMEVRGSNLLFQLRSDIDSSPIYLAVNCGANYIQDRNSPINYAQGTCIYISDSGLPKATLCYMAHFDKNRRQNKFGIQEIDVTSEYFRKKFDSCREFSYDDRNDEVNERIIEFFRKDQLQLT
jgi:hypothetical protein